MSDAPERISMVRDILGGWGLSYPHERDGTETPYILATPAALAASPEVQALIREAEARGMERAAEIARDYTPEKHTGTTLQAHVTGRNIEAAIRAEAAAIRGEGK